MEWSSLIGVAILLTLVIFVMRVLWCWLIVLLMLGPPNFAGVVVGHTVGVLTHNVGVGVLVAVVVTGLLHKVIRDALMSALSQPSLPDTSPIVSADYVGVVVVPTWHVDKSATCICNLGPVQASGAFVQQTYEPSTTQRVSWGWSGMRNAKRAPRSSQSECLPDCARSLNKAWAMR